ncbi:MAG: flippase-like domain-containing protein, partial [Verrucomicrobia bacterium]|nr:flippase-like domain-containing protein [Verrucomicrobiota bacterium]
MKSFLIKLVTSVFIGAFFSAWVVQNVNLRELATYPIDFTLIGLAIALSAAALHLRAFRWQKLLLPFIPLTYWQVFKALLVGHAMNVVLPARLGELFRVNLCKKWYALS